MSDGNKIEPHSDEAMGNSSGKNDLKVILYTVVVFMGLIGIAGALGADYAAAMVLAAPIGLAAWFFRRKLNAFSTTAVVVAMALTVWLGVSTQDQTEKARSLGFTSSDEMEEAADAGFSDKASWAKHLANMAATEKARQEKIAKEAATQAKAEREKTALEAAANSAREVERVAADANRNDTIAKCLGLHLALQEVSEKFGFQEEAAIDLIIVKLSDNQNEDTRTQYKSVIFKEYNRVHDTIVKSNLDSGPNAGGRLYDEYQRQIKAGVACYRSSVN